MPGALCSLANITIGIIIVILILFLGLYMMPIIGSIAESYFQNYLIIMGVILGAAVFYKVKYCKKESNYQQPQMQYSPYNDDFETYQ